MFQYSLAILPSANGELQHKEFLAEANGTDRWIPFIEKLIIDFGTTGDILVYNIGFERGKLSDLALSFPKYKTPINKIIARLKDLMIPFQQRWYYTPSMQGSYSIKKVLPALVPEMSYSNLNIQEGETASSVFAATVIGEFDGDEEEARRDLREYCGMDTLGMVEILRILQEGRGVLDCIFAFFLIVSVFSAGIFFDRMGGLEIFIILVMCLMIKDFIIFSFCSLIKSFSCHDESTRIPY